MSNLESTVLDNPNAASQRTLSRSASRHHQVWLARFASPPGREKQTKHATCCEIIAGRPGDSANASWHQRVCSCNTRYLSYRNQGLSTNNSSERREWFVNRRRKGGRRAGRDPGSRVGLQNGEPRAFRLPGIPKGLIGLR